MKNGAKTLAIIVGCVSIILALVGFGYNATSLSVAGRLSDFVAEENFTYFYPVYYVMSTICIIFYLLLLVMGINLIRLRLRWCQYLTILVFLEVTYFFAVGVFWMIPGIGNDVAAATAVANGGLKVQFSILFPLWAPLTLAWAKRKLEQPT